MPVAVVPCYGAMVLWCYGIYGRTADAHNEVTLITFCKDLKAVPVPFEDKLPYNKHRSFLLFSLFSFSLFFSFFRALSDFSLSDFSLSDIRIKDEI